MPEISFKHSREATRRAARTGLFAGILYWLVCSSSHCLCRADALTPAMRSQDARLQTHVTLQSPRMLVGELLERLSKQSGVTVTANDWSTAGSDDVAVSLTNVPLDDAMDALWSLFSYNNAEWEWRRSGRPGAYTYQLFRPSTARSLPDQLHEQVQADFEAQTQKLIDALSMPQDQLQEAAKHDRLLDSLLTDGRVRPGMQIFADLPPEQQQSILQGSDEYRINVSQMPPDDQNLVNQMWTWENNTIAKDTGRPTDPPLVPKHTQIRIFAVGDAGQTAPALYLDAGQGGGQYSGGEWLEDDWQKQMHTKWMMPGDTDIDPLPNQMPAPFVWPTPVATEGHALTANLLKEADTARVSMIVRIPAASDSIVDPIKTGTSIADFFKIAGTDPFDLDHKWHNDILLVTCQNWFVNAHEGARVPWAEVVRLRDTEAKSATGILPLSSLARAAYLLNNAQLHTLSAWFPVMENVANYREFLAYLDQSPDYWPHLLSAQGDDFVHPQELLADQLSIGQLLQQGVNLRLRLRDTQITSFGRPTQEIMIEVLNNASRKLMGGQGFAYTGHEYASQLQVAVAPQSSPRHDKP
jgi:hypothetical protein